jgi:thymidylate synthase ThyX
MPMTIQFVKTSVSPQGMAPSAESEALKMVEVCGRTAYKSENKITDDSARSFVRMLKKHSHLSVLEHSNIVLKVETGTEPSSSPKTETDLHGLMGTLMGKLGERNAYHRLFSLSDTTTNAFAVAGNFRGWIETLEQFAKDDNSLCRFFAYHLNRFFPSLFEPVETHEGHADGCKVSLMDPREQVEILRKSPASDLPVFVFKLVCDRGITHEVVRHRVLSFTQESTRYVNYGNKGLCLVIPEELLPFYHDAADRFDDDNPLVKKWIERAGYIAEWYQEDLDRGLKPQIARDILPNLLKSEIFVSGRWSGWEHFIKLRDSRQAHPRIRLIAKEVRAYFDSMGLVCNHC